MSSNNLRKFLRKRYRDVFGTSITGTTAAQIRATREKRKWSQQDLARRAGMRQARISLLENPNYQNLSLNTLKRIANAFDVALVLRFAPFSRLLEMIDDETPETLAVPSFEDEFGTQTSPNTPLVPKSTDSSRYQGVLGSWALLIQPTQEPASLQSLAEKQFSGRLFPPVEQAVSQFSGHPFLSMEQAVSP